MYPSGTLPMDVLLLGALAVVLIAITVWIVMWPSRAQESSTATAGESDAAQLTPQGDSFEDQYTSATADLSAGAVATTLAVETRQEEAAPLPLEPSTSAYQTAGEPRSSPTLAREGLPATTEPAATATPSRRATVGLGAAALLTLGGAIGGAWFFSRWQRERNKPARRIKRRLIR